MSDMELLQSAERDALVYFLFHRHAEAFEGMFHRPERELDIVQEWISEFYIKICNTDKAKLLGAENLRRYLNGIAKNVYMNVCNGRKFIVGRKTKKVAGFVAIDDMEIPDTCESSDAESFDENYAKVLTAMESESPERRFAIKGKYQYGMSSKEIADRLPEFCAKHGIELKIRPSAALVDNWNSRMCKKLAACCQQAA